ncbi:hypothetical protein GEV33_003941 [Tenebrio molitor]|uniref:Uncharacterized protein n=1 Tax=Tenebrio molitor TaxID=7067 RepID=A0A8J6HQE2_TENMO|nr:hypothetical protein GEV33_003941 [Tenebrio molitor]
MGRLRREATVNGGRGGLASQGKINQLNYLVAVLAENLRVYTAPSHRTKPSPRYPCKRVDRV